MQPKAKQHESETDLKPCTCDANSMCRWPVDRNTTILILHQCMGGEAITPTAYIHKLTKSTHLAYYIRGRITDVLLHRDLCPPICQGSELINKFVDTLLKHGNQGLQVAAWKKKKKNTTNPPPTAMVVYLTLCWRLGHTSSCVASMSHNLWWWTVPDLKTCKMSYNPVQGCRLHCVFYIHVHVVL